MTTLNTIRLLCLLLASCAMSFSITLNAQFEHIWHSPSDDSEVPGGITMRDPVFPGVETTASFYQGLWKGEGANQTGGTFHYRINGGTWQDQPLAFYTDSGDLQFWQSQLGMPTHVGAQIQYYFFVTLDNRDDTYLYAGGDGLNAKSLSESEARDAPYTFTVGPTSASGNSSLTVNGVNANYNVLNFYIDEINDIDFPLLEIVFEPGIPSPAQVEVFTNLNNRDRAHLDWDGDGIEDGIIPPDGNTITVDDTSAYYQAYAMADAGDGVFTLELPVEKTGAYRLTARFRAEGDPNWSWIGDQGIRDLAIVVAPRSALEMTMYELHVTNANASGPTFAQRGTFEDLHDPAARVNLQWLGDLGLNWIWFQPFHPQGIDGRETDPATGQAYDPGSPYSIRDFWQINPLYTRAYDGDLPDPARNPDNYSAAMLAFRDFAEAADAAGIRLMLDFPFNHTAPDVVLADKGIELFAAEGNPDNWQPNDLIRDRVPQFFSTNGGEGPPAYSAPAQSATHIAVAPDRNDFGKWNDVRDVYFGNYATLVTGYPDADTSRAIVRNEGDWMDYGSMGPETINVWRYFGEVLPYWIEQSGHRGFNSTAADGDADTRMALDRAGIDGLRKDFGQGLPPQAMEYIINRTHSVKWNFVFMSESLDGGEVTYRSSRHFAVLNENIVFPLAAATTTPGYRGIFEDRRNAYGQSLVLLNNLSHDEEPYADPWQALIRYATVSTNDGVPMIMYGQEIGAAQRMQETLPQGSWDWYELNFGKNIPHFKKWNSMQPQWTAWDANDLGVQFLFPVYSAIGHARLNSPALRSGNRWFLNRHADNLVRNEIFAVAKYTEPFTPAARQDVVLAFTNLDRNSQQSDTFGISPELADRLGLADGRNYNVRNMAAYLGRNNEHPGRRDVWLWGENGRQRQDLIDNGVFVALNPVPDNDASWESNPYEAQFLRIYDVTPPPPLPDPPDTGAAISPSTGDSFTVGESVTFSWSSDAFGPHDVISDFHLTVGTTPGGDDVFSGSVGTTLSHTVNVVPGNILYATVTPISAAGIAGPASPVSTLIVLDPDGDADGDGRSNLHEYIAGTDPFDPSSVFKVGKTERTGSGLFRLRWESRPGIDYAVESAADLVDPVWTVETDPLPGTGGIMEWTDPEPRTGGSRRFYRIRVVTP